MVTALLCGRRFESMRKLRFWHYRRDYFPIGLVRSAPLPADRSYLFAAFPHGLVVLGASTNFCSDANHFSRLFPNLVPYVATLRLNFWWPISRDLLMAFGESIRTYYTYVLYTRRNDTRVLVLVVDARFSPPRLPVFFFLQVVAAHPGTAFCTC